jgi:hypothetical protein
MLRSVLDKHAQLLGVRPFSASDPFSSAHIDLNKRPVADDDISAEGGARERLSSPPASSSRSF